MGTREDVLQKVMGDMPAQGSTPGRKVKPLSLKQREYMDPKGSGVTKTEWDRLQKGKINPQKELIKEREIDMRNIAHNDPVPDGGADNGGAAVENQVLNQVDPAMIDSQIAQVMDALGLGNDPALHDMVKQGLMSGMKPEDILASMMQKPQQ